jgi:hypothetical protein
MSKIADPEIFALTASERQSAVWQKLMRHFNERLAYHRAKNDSHSDATITAATRGQISIYKALISLDKDVPFQD